MASIRSSLTRNVVIAVFALGVVAATSILGQIATYRNLSPWYAGLIKPSFDPPNWVFAPVWTTLYVLMAFALWRVLRLSGPSDRTPPTRDWPIFPLLTLNAAWSWMFFWAHSPLLGLFNIAPQFVVLIATIVAFSHSIVWQRFVFCRLPPGLPSQPYLMLPSGGLTADELDVYSTHWRCSPAATR